MQRRAFEVVSGGQTGVDRAALDVAIERGLPHGGWCPLGRRAEDGPLKPRYVLQETDSPRYDDRTKRNVIDSDATLILFEGSFSGGTELTVRFALRERRPCRTIDLEASPDPAATRDWFLRTGGGRLNVAGPRESTRPGIYGRAKAFLDRLFASIEGDGS